MLDLLARLAADAIEWIRAEETIQESEILFCDIGMPGMNGYEVAESFRSDKELEDIFRVALTGYAQPDDLERAREAGFNRHLAKPVDMAILEQTLADVSSFVYATEQKYADAVIAKECNWLLR